MRAPADSPLIAVIGASFAAGVGAGKPEEGWPADLARLIGWRLEVAADPGAGFLNPGTEHLGPFSRLLSGLDLVKRQPSLVVVQGGHDDMGYAPAKERAEVESLITTIEQEAPNAHIAVVSVFSARVPPKERAWAIDRAVVQGAEAADPGVMIFNPIKSHWHYPRRPGHLHPTKQGYEWIAKRLAHLLNKNGALVPFKGATAASVSLTVVN